MNVPTGTPIDLDRLLKLRLLVARFGEMDLAYVGKTSAQILGQVLPEVFDRFKEAAAKAADVKKGTDALFTAENRLAAVHVQPYFGSSIEGAGKKVILQ